MDINCLAIDGKICFHRQLFTNHVKPSWCITGPTGPLGSTNQNWLSAKLLPMAVSIYPVVCEHSCRLLGTQHYCLCSNGTDSLPPACHPPSPPHPHHSTPTTPPQPSHPLISAIRDITGPVKTISKTSSEYCMAKLAMKQ